MNNTSTTLHSFIPPACVNTVREPISLSLRLAYCCLFLTSTVGLAFTARAGTDNTAYGNAALGSLTTGSNNSAFGAGALFHNSDGSSNTGVGKNALISNNSGNNNTAVGDRALQELIGK